MAHSTDLVFNIAKGRGVQLAKNVDDNSPAGCKLNVHVFYFTTATDDEIRDCNNITDVKALGGAAERTTNGWTKKALAGADVTLNLDDTNNNYRVDITDQTWTAVSSGQATSLIVTYDSTGADADGSLIPIVALLFPVTPDGSDVTAQIHANGILSCA